MYSTKNTVFDSRLEGSGSTHISCNYIAVYDYAKKVPGITDVELAGTTVILLINLDVYAGTAMMSSLGDAIAMCPLGDTLEEVVHHEAGGHAFAKLMDEYINYYDESLPIKDSDQLTNFRNLSGGIWKWGANIDITGKVYNVHWMHYFGKSGYDTVSYHEGGYLYRYGVWRAEPNSCMNDNVPYFNAPSREAIVRRIMEVSGGTFDINTFYTNDKTMPASGTRGEIVRPPLGEPVMVVK
ncbi:M64 family metallopeptidase [Bacteroides sp. 51]|uniref:M64 family metallopeptidase n=1 Tax=Bacteroides sp. 51 TaxID=2302938 RepID=UPI0013D1F0E7|nr:M64 family metallopeptidase [Bacteroides sp. 51]NDV82994.1 hypothetical protein [Bacteroides sp. 51]